MKRFLSFVFVVGLLLSGCNAAAVTDDHQEIFFLDLHGYPLCGATSQWEAEVDWQRYHVKNLFDDELSTAWMEGVRGDGTGERVWFEVEPGVMELVLINGYAKNEQLFSRYNRVHELEIQLWIGGNKPGRVTEYGILFHARPISQPWVIELEDTWKPQVFPIEIHWEEAQAIMEKEIDTAETRESWLYFFTLTIKDVYAGTHHNHTAMTGVSWNLKPAYAGPGGLGRLDIEGSWDNVYGSDWQRLSFQWYPFYQGWRAFVEEEVYDAGVWYMGDGVLTLVSDSKEKEYVFIGWPLDTNRILLLDEKGAMQIWEKN